MTGKNNDSQEYFIGSLVKLVASENVKKICIIASNINKLYDSEDIPLIPNKLIYSAYCNDVTLIKGVKI